jgi:hypothetical protein
MPSQRRWRGHIERT